jgi:MFS family permease
MPFMQLIRAPGVAVSIANYGLFAIFDIAFVALNPLVLASPVMLGGLGLDPPTIGVIMGAWGLLNGVFQATCFTLILDRLGARRTFLLGIGCFMPIFACFPWMNSVARLIKFGDPDEHPGAWIVWAVVGLQIMLITLMDISFGKCGSQQPSSYASC